MTDHQEATGVVLLCTGKGVVQQVVRDDLGLTGPETVGKSFVSLVDPASSEKATNFLNALAEGGVAFDWELNAQLDNRVATLHFFGGVAHVYWLIVGAFSRSDADVYYDEMMLINNEQTNTLRVAWKDVARLEKRSPFRSDASYYEGLSRLNNELANMQRELVKKNVELARANKEKNHFLGIVAHDLRNPLGAILLHSQILIEEASDRLTEDQQELLGDINSSVKFMQSLVNDLLDVAKIESGKLDLHLEPTDLVALVKHNLVLNRVFAGRKHIRLTLESDERTPPLMLDRAKIEQVLNNLINNAVKFSHPHTTVVVRIVCQDNTVVISVEDQGQGIPTDEIEELFQPFQKTSIASTAGETSTGLGLMIVQKIVAGHNGRIRVESEIGKGSTFYVSFPYLEGCGPGFV